jgi:hypothetical protein
MSELKATETGLIAVKEMHKKVVLEFPYPSERVILDPKTALGVANAMSESAYVADFGVHPNNALKTAAIEDKANKLKKRIALMLSSLKDKPNAYAAEQIVDVVLSEMS